MTTTTAEAEAAEEVAAVAACAVIFFFCHSLLLFIYIWCRKTSMKIIIINNHQINRQNNFCAKLLISTIMRLFMPRWFSANPNRTLFLHLSLCVCESVYIRVYVFFHFVWSIIKMGQSSVPMNRWPSKLFIFAYPVNNEQLKGHAG